MAINADLGVKIKRVAKDNEREKRAKMAKNYWKIGKMRLFSFKFWSSL